MWNVHSFSIETAVRHLHYIRIRIQHFQKVLDPDLAPNLKTATLYLFNCFELSTNYCSYIEKKIKNCEKELFWGCFHWLFKNYILTPGSFHPNPYSVYGSGSSHSNECGSLRVLIRNHDHLYYILMIFMDYTRGAIDIATTYSFVLHNCALTVSFLIV